MKTQYIIPNKWVGIDYFRVITGMGRTKVSLMCSSELLETKKNGRNVQINLIKYNEDLEKGLFENLDLQNVYKKKSA